MDEFNAKNRWRKRGLGMIPVKYGSGYNFVQIEQAAAIISINQGDGSVIIHQGGVEMGQGLTTADCAGCQLRAQCADGDDLCGDARAPA